MSKSPHELGEIKPLLARPGLTVLGVVLLLVVYYAIPLRADRSLPIRITTLAVVLGGLFWVSARELRRSNDPVGRLIVLLVLVILVFAGAFYAVATIPGQFVGLETRTDSLYFTVITMATVGYGDIHPLGQGARMLVIASVAFNLVVVAALASSIVSRLRPTPRASGTDHEEPDEAADNQDP